MAKRQKKNGGAMWRRKMPMSMRSQLRNDLVNTGRGPSVGAILEYKQRTLSIKDGDEPVDKFLNTPAGRYDMKRVRLAQEGLRDIQRRQHVEREYVKHVAEQIEEFLGPFNPDYCIVLEKGSKYVSRMYWTEEHEYFIMRHDQWARKIEKSNVFSCAEVAKTVYVNRMVQYRASMFYPPAPNV